MRIKKLVLTRHQGHHREALYQIRERVKLLSHQRGLFAPPSNLAVHEIEKQTEWHESESSPQSAIVGRVAETIAHGGKDGHDCLKLLIAERGIEMYRLASAEPCRKYN